MIEQLAIAIPLSYLEWGFIGFIFGVFILLDATMLMVGIKDREAWPLIAGLVLSCLIILFAGLIAGVFVLV